MEKEKLVKLLSSSSEEDTLIGINYLLDNYTFSWIKDFFNELGNSLGSSVGMVTRNVISRSVSYKTPVWKYYYRGSLGFYIGKSIMLVYHPHIHHNFWDPEEI